MDPVKVEQEQPQEAPSAPEAKQTDPWDELAKVFESNSDDEGEAPEVSKEPVEAAQPSTEEREEPAGAEPEPEEKQPEPDLAASQPEQAQPKAAVEPEQETPPAEAEPVQQEAPTQTPEQLAEMRMAAEEQLTTYFALSDEDAEKLIERPQEVLPKLAAKVYLDVYDAVMKGVQTVLPQMVVGLQRQKEVESRAESAFYDKWKGLNTQQGRELVNRLGMMYRQLNPRANLDQFIQDVGLQASIQLRLPIEGYTTQSAPSQVPSAIPVQPASTTSHPRVAPASDRNPFSVLADEFLEEERYD